MPLGMDKSLSLNALIAWCGISVGVKKCKIILRELEYQRHTMGKHIGLRLEFGFFK